jgi:ATP-dependent protease ClpP protease subunit
VNFGTVESMGIILYCAGDRRLTASRSRFIIHRLAWRANGVYTEDRLREYLRGLQVDHANAAQIIVERCGLPLERVTRMLAEGTVLNATEAKEISLTQEVTDDFVEQGAHVVAVPV